MEWMWLVPTLTVKGECRQAQPTLLYILDLRLGVFFLSLHTSGCPSSDIPQYGQQYHCLAFDPPHSRASIEQSPTLQWPLGLLDRRMGFVER